MYLNSIGSLGCIYHCNQKLTSQDSPEYPNLYHCYNSVNHKSTTKQGLEKLRTVLVGKENNDLAVEDAQSLDLVKISQVLLNLARWSRSGGGGRDGNSLRVVLSETMMFVLLLLK